MKKLWIILCYFILISKGLAETPLPPPVFSDFTFQGQPIEPQCIDKFFGDSSRYAPIFLKRDACQSKKQRFDSSRFSEGLLGYSSEDGSSIYYKSLGTIQFEGLKKPLYHLIYSEWSGGGSGHFSSINIVEKSEYTLRLIDSIAEGDRCNGGVLDVNYKDGILTYDQLLTPHGLYTLVAKKAPSNNDFKDCATCCLGYVTYHGSEIARFTFDKEMLDLEASPSSPAQECYNQIIKETLKRDNNTLTYDELKVFIHNIEQTCVTKDSLTSS